MTHVLAPAPDTESMEQLAADIQRRWADGETPDAAAALNAHPELRPHKPLVLELAYEEFCLRAERGVAPEPRVFAARFPYPESVARLLAIHSAIGRQSLGSLGRPTVRLAPGDTVGDRVVVRRLGRGGFADVYLLADPRLGGQAVVVKVSTRGEHEAHTLGRLKHKHVMEVTDVIAVDKYRGMLSPFLGLATGETLVERANGVKPSAAWLLGVAGELPPGAPPFAARSEFPITPAMPYPRAVLHIAAAIADTLAYVHGEGLSHRDLKPSNLLIGPTGYPYLLDFNLADDGQSGRVGGTIGYAAPEVLAALTVRDSSESERAGRAVNWAAADVFSFAVLVFELLLLRHPYLVGTALDHIDGGTVALAAASAREKLAKASLSLPKAVRRLLLDCLHPNPAERPTAAQLARELAAVLAPRRRVWAWATAAAVVVALSGVGVAWAFRGDHNPPVPPEGVTAREPTEPFERGVWLVRHGQSDVAIPAFTKAAETDTSGRAFEWLGYCHARAGNIPTAIEYDGKALDAGRKTAVVYANRAASYLTSGDTASALADVEEALTIDPNCKSARLTRASAYFRMTPQDQPLPRLVVEDLNAGMEEMDERRGALLAQLAEAHVWVADPIEADRERALWALNRAVRVGYSISNIEKREVFAKQLDPERYRAALIVTDDERLPLDVRSKLIIPDE